jgi:hypothetical protein
VRFVLYLIDEKAVGATQENNVNNDKEGSSHQSKGCIVFLLLLWRMEGMGDCWIQSACGNINDLLWTSQMIN